MAAASLASRLRAVRLVVCDVDGVLTDGGIILDEAGRDWKRFSVLDGVGLVLARLGGLKTAWITGRASRVTAARARECGVDALVQGVKDKRAALDRVCRRFQLPAAAAVFVGDDLIDLPAMQAAGLAVAVANAVPEVKRAAHWVTRAGGGSGAVREVIERVLASQGTWAKAKQAYLHRHAAGR